MPAAAATREPEVPEPLPEELGRKMCEGGSSGSALEFEPDGRPRFVRKKICEERRIFYSLDQLKEIKNQVQPPHRPQVRSSRARKRDDGKGPALPPPQLRNYTTEQDREEMVRKKLIAKKDHGTIVNSTTVLPTMAQLNILLNETQELTASLQSTPQLPAPGLDIKICLLRETDPRRLAQRSKQIGFGKDSIGYLNYLRAIPKEQRKEGDPLTPRAELLCGKRTFDKVLMEWKRALHRYDSLEFTEEGKPDWGTFRPDPFDPSEIYLIEQAASRKKHLALAKASGGEYRECDNPFAPTSTPTPITDGLLSEGGTPPRHSGGSGSPPPAAASPGPPMAVSPDEFWPLPKESSALSASAALSKPPKSEK